MVTTRDKSSELCRRITITARGKDEAELAAAEVEAWYRIQVQECTSGADHNDEGGFYFEVTGEVPEGEHPA